MWKIVILQQEKLLHQGPQPNFLSWTIFWPARGLFNAFGGLFVCLFVCLCVRLFVCLFVCLLVCSFSCFLGCLTIPTPTASPEFWWKVLASGQTSRKMSLAGEWRNQVIMINIVIAIKKMIMMIMMMMIMLLHQPPLPTSMETPTTAPSSLFQVFSTFLSALWHLCRLGIASNFYIKEYQLYSVICKMLLANRNKDLFHRTY